MAVRAALMPPSGSDVAASAAWPRPTQLSARDTDVAVPLDTHWLFVCFKSLYTCHRAYSERLTFRLTFTLYVTLFTGQSACPVLHTKKERKKMVESGGEVCLYNTQIRHLPFLMFNHCTGFKVSVCNLRILSLLFKRTKINCGKGLN